MEEIENTSVATRIGIEERLKPVCSESSPVGSTPTPSTKKKTGPKPREWECKYCKQIFISRRVYYEHKRTCEERLKLPLDSKGRVIGVYDRSAALKKFVERKIADEGYYKGHPQTEETKRKLSEARKRNLENGIGNHWINPSIKRSYAEQYFYDCFVNAGLSFENNIWVGHYCLDFKVGNNYFEVDGEQHYTEDGLKKDQRREEFLKTKNLKLVGRCRWSEFCKMSFTEKEKYVKDIIALLMS